MRAGHRQVDGPSEDGAPPIPDISFSTDLLPERDRIAFFKEELAQLVSLDVELLDERPRYSFHSAVAGSALIYAAETSATAFIRKRHHLADCREDFLFHYVSAGHQVVDHRGHSARVGAGESCLLDSASAGDVFVPEGAAILCVRIDGASLRALARDPGQSAGRLIEAERPGVALLKGYIQSILESRQTLIPELRRSAGAHIADLIASVIGATRDGAEQARTGGVRAARLRHVLDEIAARACAAGFGVEIVAAELGVTPRTVQLVLEETGSTFSEHVQEHRLRRGWQLLAAPDSGLSIAEIAYEAGFNDLSHFYRSFRRRFGDTPAGVRASSRQLH
jgi:AraC-like DNA-binding protein